MATVRSFVAPEVDDPARVIERLGWAVIRQWADLPPPIRLLLGAQAGLTALAGSTPTQVTQIVNAFIREQTRAADS